MLNGMNVILFKNSMPLSKSFIPFFSRILLSPWETDFFLSFKVEMLVVLEWYLIRSYGLLKAYLRNKIQVERLLDSFLMVEVK